MSSNKSVVNVSLSSVPFESTAGQRGRPQTNARLYVSFVNTQRLLREGWTEKQLRREAFVQVRKILGLAEDTVIARSADHSYYMVKHHLGSNFAVTVTAAAD